MKHDYSKELTTILGSKNAVRWAQYAKLISDLLSDPAFNTSNAKQNITYQLAMVLIEAITPPAKRTWPSVLSKPASEKFDLNMLLPQLKAMSEFLEPPVKEFTYKLIGQTISNYTDTNRWGEATKLVSVFNDASVAMNIKAYVQPHDKKLLEAAKFFNELPLYVLADTARLMSVYRYKEHVSKNISPSDQVQMNRFINRLAELQLLILTAQYWGVSETRTVITDREVNWKGSGIDLQYDQLMIGIHFINEQTTIGLIKHIQKATTALDDNALSKIIHDAKKNFLDLATPEMTWDDIKFNEKVNEFLKAGKIFLSQVRLDVSSETSHAISIGTFNEWLCYADRGLVNAENSGIKVYKITDNIKRKALELTSRSVTAADVAKILNLSKVEMIDFMPMKHQKIGNCAAVAAKSIFRIAIYFNVLKHLEQNNPGNVDNFNVAKQISAAAYKWFSAQQRLRILKEYLTLPPEFRDRDLLADIYSKVRKESWQTKGMQELNPLFDATIQDLSNQQIIAQLNDAITAGNKVSVEALIGTVKYNNVRIPNEIFKKAIVKANQSEDSLQIVKLILQNYELRVTDSKPIYSPVHLLEEILATINVSYDSPRALPIFAAIESLDVNRPEHLLYQVMSSNLTKVTKLSENMRDFMGAENLTNKFPLEMAIQVMAIYSYSKDEKLESAIKIVERLIETGIKGLPTTGARKLFDDVIDSHKSAAETPALELDATVLERIYKIIDTIDQPRRMSLRAGA